MSSEPLLGGRYELHDEIGSGGMATVHLARLRGAGGFARVVALKRMHPHLAKDPDFVAMFLDEARVASRVHHPNVVAINDVVSATRELFLVMDYVPGVTLSELLGGENLGNPPPVGVALRIIHDALSGLHAAHTAHDEHGASIHLVHRDVSPQNFLVGADGVTRVLDFGIAKADGRLQPRTAQDQIKGKLGYMAPEQLMGETVDPRTDVYAVGICLWETLLARRARQGTEAEVLRRVMDEDLPALATTRSDLDAGVSAIVVQAAHRDRRQRFKSAGAMAAAIAERPEIASHAEVKSWMHERAAAVLAERASWVAKIEANETTSVEPISVEPGSREVVPREATSKPSEAIRVDKTSGGMSASVTLPRRSRKGAFLLAAIVAVALVSVSVWFFQKEARAPSTSAEERANVATSSVPAGNLAAHEPDVSPRPSDSAALSAPSSSAKPVALPRRAQPERTAPLSTSKPRKETLY